jgi:hypothetical protein
MPPAKSNSKSKSSDAPGVKTLIAAASLAATLGGWALLSAQEAQPAAQFSTLLAAPQIASQAALQAEAPTRMINLAPLPTLVPLAPHSQLVTAANTTASRSIARPAAPVQQTAPAQPALRVVSAPSQQNGRPQSGGSSASAPAPVTNTRSSR